jgi:hypothetical protein
MDARNVCMDYRFWEEEPDSPNIVTLHFTTKCAGKKPQPRYIEEGPTILNFCSTGTILNNYESFAFSFSNSGGVSQGLSIIIMGDCFADNAVTIEEMSFQFVTSEMVQQSFTAKAQKEQFPDGRHGLIFNFNDFIFPKGIDIKQIMTLPSEETVVPFLQSIIRMRFTAKIHSGNKHKVSLHIIPKENRVDGQCSTFTTIYESPEQIEADWMEE